MNTKTLIRAAIVVALGLSLSGCLIIVKDGTSNSTPPPPKEKAGQST